MLKRISKDPSIYFLIAGNLYCIWNYKTAAGSFATVVWIYWFQSVIIGFFNFVDLLTVTNYDKTALSADGKTVPGESKGCTAIFFVFHFGAFHLAYGFYLLLKYSFLTVDGLVWMLGVAAFFMESVFNFMKQKQLEKNQQVQLGTLFFLPYLRILPMHLMILLPAFTGWAPSLLFLVLKMVADIFSALLYYHIYRSKTVG